MNSHEKPWRIPGELLAGLLLVLMAVLAGGAALRESVTIDEVAHIGAGVSYLQKLDLRMNPEHPPLAKVLAALPLVCRGVRADYSHISWTASEKFLPAFLGRWVFGDWLLERWNDPKSVLAWARLPMLLLTLALGCAVYLYARRLGGVWGGLLCLSVYVSTPAFLTFGPLVHTDLAVTLFSACPVDSCRNMAAAEPKECCAIRVESRRSAAIEIYLWRSARCVRRVFTEPALARRSRAASEPARAAPVEAHPSAGNA